jgi:transcriptional regulator with XRE-family HTH domain
MKEVGKRLKALRDGAMLSQVKMAEALGSTQSSINRYENGQATPTVALFRTYADYFDVSMDYIFARTDKPQGKQYEYKPNIAVGNQQMRQFIDMCFDPESPVSEKMKETLLQMMGGQDA